jgi:putative oxidoreductase
MYPALTSGFAADDNAAQYPEPGVNSDSVCREIQMKIASLSARILLGVIFFIFGLNGFVHFITIPPVEGIASQFMGALFLSHYLAFIFFLELLGGTLLLVNFFVPLALVVLGPIVVNIIFFHALMAPGGVPRSLVVAFLWLVVAWFHRRYFTGIFVVKAETLT